MEGLGHKWCQCHPCLIISPIRHVFIADYEALCWSQGPRGLRRGSAAARLLRSWVRIPPGSWLSICCVLSGRGLCDELTTRPEESYRLWCVVVCDLETSWMRTPWLTGGCCAKKEKKCITLPWLLWWRPLHEVHTSYQENRSAVSESEMAVLTGTKRHAAKQRHGRHGDLTRAMFRFCWSKQANRTIGMLLFPFGRFRKIAKSDY